MRCPVTDDEPPPTPRLAPVVQRPLRLTVRPQLLRKRRSSFYVTGASICLFPRWPTVLYVSHVSYVSNENMFHFVLYVSFNYVSYLFIMYQMFNLFPYVSCFYVSYVFICIIMYHIFNVSLCIICFTCIIMSYIFHIICLMFHMFHYKSYFSYVSCV